HSHATTVSSAPTRPAHPHPARLPTRQPGYAASSSQESPATSSRLTTRPLQSLRKLVKHVPRLPHFDTSRMNTTTLRGIDHQPFVSHNRVQLVNTNLHAAHLLQDRELVSFQREFARHLLPQAGTSTRQAGRFTRTILFTFTHE